MHDRPRHLASDTQLRLAFPRFPQFDRDRFVVSECNRDAAMAVDAWPDWLGGRLTLVGPEGAGKTHLARAWAATTGAFIANDDNAHIAMLPAGPVLYEDADRRPAGALLFHLLNRTEAGGALLLTARTPPRCWTTDLPDLRSRLNALPVATLREPDDRVLEGVLLKLFRERGIRPEPDLLSYLLRRIERSVPAARTVVAHLDDAADAAGRGVTRALAREVLEGVDDTLDLFE